MTLLRLALVVSLASCVHGDPEPPYSLSPREVDPSAEASLVERGLARAGFVVRTRLAGRGFVALAAELPPNQATAIRVVTKLGTVLGVDAPDHASPLRRRVALLDGAGARDLDGDGQVELLIELVDELDGRCIALARVLEDGRVLEVPLRTSDFGAHACAEDARNVLGDARPELLVRYRAPREQGGRIPTVHVPFVGQNGVWTEADRTLTRPFYEAERADRDLAIQIAERNEDAAEVAALRAERTLLDALLARDARPEAAP